MSDKKAVGWQFLRYGLVGIVTNLAGYLVYLLITRVGVEPEIAMSCLYGVGALLGFIGHRRVSFGHNGSYRPAALRYLLAHALGYGLNLAMLRILVTNMGYPHELVQATAVCCVAIVLFLVFRFLVFPLHNEAEELQRS